MSPGKEYSVESARAAQQQGRLEEWVAGFLASPGSDNEALGAVLLDGLDGWVGPVQLPVDQMQRLAGPPGHPVLCPVTDDYWDDRVEDIEEKASQGWDPPPVIVAYRDGQLVLEDGNHRVEGSRRAGHRMVWAVVGFEHPSQRASFLRKWSAPA